MDKSEVYKLFRDAKDIKSDTEYFACMLVCLIGMLDVLADIRAILTSKSPPLDTNEQKQSEGEG